MDLLDKKLITEKDARELLEKGAKNLTISKNTIITPLALDMIAGQGIVVEYTDRPPEDKELSGERKLLGAGSSGSNTEAYDLKVFQTELLLKFYYLMLKIRLFEELVKNYKERNIIPGLMVHSYIGQEAIAAGVCCALEKKDYLTSTHRGHGHLIAKGADPARMLAEILGRADGYCRGKGGSMHITDIDLGILGANGIVGAGMPIACGSALVSRIAGDGAITVSFFGDGASNQGTFGESLNFAGIFSLPVLFLCENNGYAVSTPVSYACGTENIYRRGEGYGIVSECIDGDDVFAVFSVCKKHVEEMRKRPHPVLIEAVTHRQIGHWVGDPQKYRTRQELENLPGYDPIRLFLNKIKSRADISDSNLTKIESRVSDEIKKAAIFAEKSPYPPQEEATEDFLKQ